MKIKIGDPSRINLDQGEEVTIRVLDSVGVLEHLNYSKDGTVIERFSKVGEPHRFQFNKSAHLGVSVLFSGETGGQFTLRITGSKGGDVHESSYSQSPGESVRQIAFLCDIEGNPTTHWG